MLRMATSIPVVLYEFTSSKDWQPCRPTDRIKTNVDVPRRFTLTTWNVWYEPVEDKLRYREILNQIHKAEELDVIAFQEVTPRFLDELRGDESVRRHWLITDRWDDDHRKVLRENGYGIMFLVNRALEVNVEASLAAFPTSKSGRYAQLLEIKMGNCILVWSLQFRVTDERQDWLTLTLTLLSATRKNVCVNSVCAPTF
jgi:endonuclease/exonuclease/phosphatase family metal-dependent hydrolase